MHGTRIHALDVKLLSNHELATYYSIYFVKGHVLYSNTVRLLRQRQRPAARL
jgi:hypothetical protein